MMKLAVREVNALPRVLKIDAVAAFEIAASFAVTIVPSKPVGTKPVIGFGICEGPGPPPRNCVVTGAPVILKTPSTFASRSVTATVTGWPNWAAAETACAMIVCTSAVVNVPAVAAGCTGGAVVPGVGTEPGSSGGPSPT